MEMNTPATLSKGSKPFITECFEHDRVWYPPVTSWHTIDQLKTFEVREDDLILVTYIKSGTHWILELLLLIQEDGQVENVRREEVNLNREFTWQLPPDFKKCAADVLVTCSSPRFYRTHLPVQHLPPQVWTKQPKVVYLTRDPKDCCASMYRFLNANPAKESEVTWSMVFDLFTSGRAMYGNWADHALGYWEHRKSGHICYVTYEEMKQDIRSVIRRLAKFMGKAISTEGLERIVQHSSFNGMKRTYARVEEEYENGQMFTRCYGQIPFLLKGVSGGWRDLFSEYQQQTMDKIMKERLTGTGLDVYYPYP